MGYTTATYTEPVVTNRDFGVQDRFGRKIGAAAVTYETTYVELEDQTNGGYTQPAGHYFTFRPCATRNGIGYGASQGRHNFKTIEERQAAIDKYFAGAQKRAIKNQGK